MNLFSLDDLYAAFIIFILDNPLSPSHIGSLFLEGYQAYFDNKIYGQIHKDNQFYSCIPLIFFLPMIIFKVSKFKFIDCDSTNFGTTFITNDCY